MRKLMIPVLAVLSLSAQANEWIEKDKPVVCGPFREIAQTLMQEHREMPLWIGQSSQDSTRFALFTNIDNGTWTLVQYGKVNGCILGIGEMSHLLNSESLSKKQ